MGLCDCCLAVTGVVAFCIGLMAVALGPFAYVIYIETSNSAPLLELLPRAAAVYSHINLVLLPCSWLIFYFAIFCTLPFDEKLCCGRKAYARIVISLSFILFAATICNIVVLYAWSFENFRGDLRSTISYYNTSLPVQVAWQTVENRTNCCGASGSSDWIAAGVSFHCKYPTFGCMEAITNSMFIVSTLTITAQGSSVMMAYRDGMGKSNDTRTPQVISNNGKHE